MAFDPLTILTLTIAIAAAAAIYLLMEWRSARDSALLYWAAGFATVTVGSSLSLLRVDGYFVVGVWLANGLLIFAHWLFLFGVIRFMGGWASRIWWLLPFAWCLLLLLPEGPQSSKFYLVFNSVLVGLISLRASALLRLAPDIATVGTRQLHYVLLVHGAFYIAKAAITLLPGTLIDLAVFRVAPHHPTQATLSALLSRVRLAAYHALRFCITFGYGTVARGNVLRGYEQIRHPRMAADKTPWLWHPSMILHLITKPKHRSPRCIRGCAWRLTTRYDLCQRRIMHRSAW